MDLEPVARSLRLELELSLHTIALTHAVALEAQRPCGLTEPTIPHADDCQQRKRRDDCDGLGPTQGKRPEEADGSQQDCSTKPGRSKEAHRRGGVRSSAAGVGTWSRHSSTMSSPRIRCSQSSGARVSRCASAGPATAFTSSGVTKPRESSIARPRASLSSARPPRGLEPT